MAAWTKVCLLSDIPFETGKLVYVAHHSVGLFRVGQTVQAINAICPHQGGLLTEGWLREKIVTCPWHGWDFDVTTGKCTHGPEVKQKTFRTKVDGGAVFLWV